MMATESIGDVTRELALACGAFLTWLLAASALHKLLRPARGVLAVRELLGASPAVAFAAVLSAATLEAVAALLACIPAVQLLGTLLAAGVFLVYAMLLAWAVSQGRRHLDCGCTLSVSGRSLGISQIARAAGLCALACSCSVVFGCFGGAAPSVSAVLAGLAGLTLYFAAEQLNGLMPLRSGLPS